MKKQMNRIVSLLLSLLLVLGTVAVGGAGLLRAAAADDVADAISAINEIGMNDGSNAYKLRFALAYVAYSRLTPAQMNEVTNADILIAAMNTLQDYDCGACGPNTVYYYDVITRVMLIGGVGPTDSYVGICDDPFLLSAVIEEGVTSVGEELFFHDYGLDTVTLPKSLKSINRLAFAGCDPAMVIHYAGSEADWNQITIDDDAFEDVPGLTIRYYDGVQGTINAINDIGTVEHTDACKARIDAARAAYDRLSDYESAQVTNYDVLLAAEAAYAAPEAPGTGKAIQLVSGGTAANITGAQASNVYYGTYRQSRDGAGGYNVEPIQWRVLENKDGKLFLLSDQILDGFYDYNEASTGKWEEFHLRRWLNGAGKYETNNFKDSAFTATEYDAIALTDTDVGNIHTQDKVFFLSIDEATNTAYGFEDTSGSSGSRVAKATDYANGNYIGGDWYLRSPSEDLPFDEFSSVESWGDVNTSGRGFIPGSVGERPAFKIDLNKVLFTSAAEGGKTGNGLTAVSDYTGADWKLTLLDESRSGFTASACRLGDKWVITYSGATTGTNEKISAMIVDADGNITYYGVLGDAQTGTNTVTLNTAGKLNEGDKLYVFNEQCNGDKKTDCASALVEITDAPEFHEIPKCDIATLNDGDYWFDIHSLLEDEHYGSGSSAFSLLQNLSTFYVSADGSTVLIKQATAFNGVAFIEHTYTAGDARFAYLKQHVKPACEVVALSEEFESEPTGWTFVDADGDGFNWSLSTNSFDSALNAAHSGYGILYSESYTKFNNGALTPDNWAITPAIVVPAEDATLTFWTTGQDSSGYISEHYGVFIYEAADPAAPALPAGKPADYMTKLMENTNDRSRAYMENTVDLSDYAGKTVFLAIRHFDCKDQFYLNLDSVTVKGYQHTYGDTGADRYTCTVCGTVNETRKDDPVMTLTLAPTINDQGQTVAYQGQTVTVTANLPADAEGTVDFRIEGVNIDIVYPFDGVAVQNGKAQASGVFDVGDYVVKATYSGAGHYKAATAETPLSVTREPFTLDLTMQDGKFTIPYGRPAVAIVTIPEDATHQAPASGDITLTLNGNTVGTYDAENGVLTFDFTANEKLAPGDYTVHATYNGDAHYAPQDDEISFVVTEATPEITISATPTNAAATAYDVTITKPKDAVEGVTFTVFDENDETVAQIKIQDEDFEDGVFTLVFPGDLSIDANAGTFMLQAYYYGGVDPIYKNNLYDFEIKLGCDHVWNEPEWSWNDDDLSNGILKVDYAATCQKCSEGEATGTADVTKGAFVEATLNDDAYTTYTAQVTLGTQTFSDEHKVYEAGTMHQARANALEEYKETLIDAANGKALAGDSEKAAALIAATVDAINGVTYDPDRSLDENKAAADTAANLDALDEALADQRAADAVEKAINEIGEVALTDESKGRIDAARAAYDALTDAQKARVPDEAKQALTDAEADYQLLDDKATFEAYKDAVKDAADALGKADDSAKTAAMIDAAKKAVDDLNYDESKPLDDNKAAVDTAANLQQLAAGLDDQRAADAVETAINDIGEVALTDESKGRIDAARAAYDALTDAQKARVPDEAKQALTDAEDAYELLDNKDQFESYKEALKDAALDKALEGDSAQSAALIEAAIAAIEAKEYDESKSLDDNKQALTDAAALDQLDEDLAAHRHVYHAVFMADGQEVASIPFTIDSEPITAPEAPVLDNRTFTGWTPAIPTQMPAEDLRFDAVYQENAGLTITDNAKEQGDDRVIGYKETVKFSTDPSALPADVKLMWYVDGRESSMGLNATVEKPQEDYTIQVKALRADGSVYAESEVQTVKVDQSFWAKLLDLLRSLFEWLVSAVKNIVGAVAGGF